MVAYRSSGRPILAVETLSYVADINSPERRLPPTSAIRVCDELQRGRKIIHTLLS